ncbi:MAG: helix-turn-helix domain-containing protein, partial [Pseudolabrys sp.]
MPSAPALKAIQEIPAPKPGNEAGGGTRLRERNCSIARTVAILSDAWTFLIIREAFFGARRFESFRSSLGLPRATLTDRLRRLTEQGIFRQLPYSKT